MTRYQRTTHADAFASEGDFNEQLYLALRQSPWWMTSVAVHVLVFFILTLMDTSAEAAPPRRVMKAELHADDPADEQEVAWSFGGRLDDK